MNRLIHIFAGSAFALMLPLAASAFGDLPTEMISETPAGTAVNYERSCNYYYTYQYRHYEGTVEGSALTMVEDADGNVYLNNINSNRATKGWVKGVRQGDDIVITFPQLVDEEIWAQVGYINKYVDEYGIDQVDVVILDDQTITLTGDGNGSYSWTASTESGEPIGIALFGYNSYGLYNYASYCDTDISLSPLAETAVTIPEGLEQFQCGMVYSYGNTRFVQAAIDEEAGMFYILDLYSGLSAVGRINGDKVEFDNGLLLGTANNFYIFQSAALASETITAEGSQTISLSRTDKAIFSYDAATRTIAPIDGASFVFERGNGSGNTVEQFLAPHLTPQDEYVEGIPMDPMRVRLITGNQDFSQVYVNIVCATNDYLLIDPATVYYSIYLEDDEDPFIFMKKTYTGLSKNTDMIPFNYSDNWDFYAIGATRYFFLYQYIEKIGAQAIVIDEDDTRLISGITYYPYVNSIEGISTDGREVKAELYFDLQGRRVASPSTGLYIRQTIFSDGSAKSEKILLR